MGRNLFLDWTAFTQEARQRRKTQGLNQQQLAILTGMSKPTLNAFEHGQTTLTLKNAFKILHVPDLATAP